MALPSALIETYGLKTKNLMLLIDGAVMAVFSLAMLVWWIIRYRQTGQRIETLWKEIEHACVLQENVKCNVRAETWVDVDSERSSPEMRGE